MRLEDGIYLASMDDRVIAGAPATDEDLASLHVELEMKSSLDFRTGLWLVEQLQAARKESDRRTSQGEIVMGNWAIIIQGTGQHHNNQDNDADRIAAHFTDALVKAGQNVESATFTNGARLDLPTQHD